MSTNTLFDLYFEYVKDTESPKIFHRWSLIASVGALLGRQYYMPFGTTRIFPNQYIMLIGNPGTRKSSAIKTAKKILAHTGYDTFAAEKTTKEKFLLDLEGAPEGENYGQYNTGNSRRKSTANQILTPEDVLRSLELPQTNQYMMELLEKSLFVLTNLTNSQEVVISIFSQ